MKVSVLQENLNKGLGIANRAVAARAQLPVLANVLLTTDRGKLKFSATNLETGINYWVGAKVEEEGSVSVPAKILSEFVSSLPAGRIELTAKEGMLTVETDSFKSEFVSLPTKEFPAVPTLNQKPSFEFEAETFTRAVSQVAFAAAQDETRPVLTGVFLGVRDGRLVLAATDGYRLSLKKISLSKEVGDSELFKKGLIIPASALSEVIRVVGSGEESQVGLTFTKEANQAIFSTGEAEVVSRLIEGEFPNFEKILPEKGTTQVVVEREGLLRAVKVASIFAREAANVIRLEVLKTSLKLSANTAEVGSNISRVEAQVSGEGSKIAFNSRYLLDFLNAVDAETIAFEMSSSLNPGAFMPEKDSSFLHIIMPVRIQD